MKCNVHIPYLCGAVALLIAGIAPTAHAQSCDGLRDAAFSTMSPGPVAVVGTVASSNFSFTPELWPDPTVALIDITGLTQTPINDDFVDQSRQLLGYTTKDLFPGPGEIQINLPIVPEKPSELANTPQVFGLIVAANLTGDSYLRQLEQTDGLFSVISDPVSGRILEGSVLVHSPPGNCSFPVAAGADGQWFTEDDRQGKLEHGYTAVRLNKDGSSSFDRSPKVRLDVVEPVEAASPDFSSQSMTAAFDNLIKTLSERYAYTQLRSLDWQEISKRYRPRIVAAEADDDMGKFYLALNDMALSIGDAHVHVTAGYGNAAVQSAKNEALVQRASGSIGARAIAVSQPGSPDKPPSDDLYIVDVALNTPADQAGLVPGTQILTINGQTIADRYESMPPVIATSVEEVSRFYKTAMMLRFAPDDAVTITYRLPGETTARTAEMTAGNWPDAEPRQTDTEPSMPIEVRRIGDYTFVSWANFLDYLLPKIGVLEEALAVQNSVGSEGMILDLRGNGGGLVELYQIMASYFFDADNPMPVHVFDRFVYDADRGRQVELRSPDYMISAPDPKLAYSKPVVILIDEACASACEYFAQHLQRLGRAKVVGQYASLGAGGFIDRVSLPGDISFQFTLGKTTFPGTQTPNLEGKGVVPDIRVPVTLETELAKLEGKDPVLNAAIAELDAQNDPTLLLSANIWHWVAYADANFSEVKVPQDEGLRVRFGETGLDIQTSCGNWSASYSFDAKTGALSVTEMGDRPNGCTDDDHASQLARFLGAAQSLEIRDRVLYLTADPSSGALILQFEPDKQ